MFVVAVVVGIGTIAMAIIGVVALSGGFTPTYVEPRYPKPEGYRFDGARIEGDLTLCVDPREGPDTDWLLLDLAEQAVGILKAASPSLPVAITGICRAAGGDAQGDGTISWERMDGLWGRARGTDIALDPEITPPSWVCNMRVLTHELGHLVGLGHQPDDVPSVMHSSGCDYDLTLIDVQALQYLYEGRSR